MIGFPQAKLTRQIMDSDALFVALAVVYAYLASVSFTEPRILEGTCLCMP